MANCIRYKSIAFLFGMAMLFSCQSDLKTIDELTRIDEGPMESVFNVEIVYTDQGHTRMIMNAEQMDRYEGEEPYLELPKGLHVQFYDTLGNKTSSMSSRYAISYDDPEIIEARNDVVVINEAGERLNTEQLIWDQKEEIIYSDKFVKITTEEEVLYGEGFESDERFDRWKITSPRGTFQAETGRAGEPGRETPPEPVDEDTLREAPGEEVPEVRETPEEEIPEDTLQEMPEEEIPEDTLQEMPEEEIPEDTLQEAPVVELSQEDADREGAPQEALDHRKVK